MSSVDPIDFKRMSGWKSHFSQKRNNGRNKGSRNGRKRSKRKSKKTETTQDDIIMDGTEGIKKRNNVEKDERNPKEFPEERTKGSFWRDREAKLNQPGPVLY